MKSKVFSRKENVSYVEMESSSEESDFELPEVDLAELKKGPPYICSFLKKISNVDRYNDKKHKSEKKYRQNTTFDKRFKEKTLLLDLIQEEIMEGRLKFHDGKKDTKVDSNPFDAGANFGPL
ncbi:hypothetical protein Ahy_A07g032190 [Arachis hypogaea]|uniref:Uncharacterized protein n=1 Tax=Arachis hypogaea TaxID=3818 RepID=A0A445C6F3_ARAHY|nr:hypothetical protein Ahy_A07g032190 [Arachis hypogaea]